jgi:hypothetical protein
MHGDAESGIAGAVKVAEEFAAREAQFVTGQIHGVKAIEDRALMDFLAEQRIGVESCLTSNIQTSTVGDGNAVLLRLANLGGAQARLRCSDLIFMCQLNA